LLQHFHGGTPEEPEEGPEQKAAKTENRATEQPDIVEKFKARTVKKVTTKDLAEFLEREE